MLPESFAHRGCPCQFDKINARRKKINAPRMTPGAGHGQFMKAPADCGLFRVAKRENSTGVAE
jgi:hypothetical protein